MVRVMSWPGWPVSRVGGRSMTASRKTNCQLWSEPTALPRRKLRAATPQHLTACRWNRCCVGQGVGAPADARRCAGHVERDGHRRPVRKALTLPVVPPPPRAHRAPRRLRHPLVLLRDADGQLAVRGVVEDGADEAAGAEHRAAGAEPAERPLPRPRGLGRRGLGGGGRHRQLAARAGRLAKAEGSAVARAGAAAGAGAGAWR